MKKRLFVFLIILSTIFFNIGFVSSQPNSSANAEYLVKKFLCNKMFSIVTGNIDDIDKYFSNKTTDSQKYLMFIKQNLLEDYLIAYSANDYVIEKVAPQAKIISSEIKGSTATIKATLRTDIFWNASNALGKPIAGTKCESHTLILVKEDTGWKILADKYRTDRMHSDEALNGDIGRMTRTVEKLKKEAKNSMDRAKHSQPARLSPSSTVNSMSATGKRYAASTVYNRNAAYSWARAYWHNYSDAYVNLGSQPWEGGDCTNFISQCLRAGGANNDKIGSYQWYYDNNGTANTSDDRYSWTWSTARGLNYILLGNYKNNEFGPKGVEKVISADAQYDSSIGQFVVISDLIQYEWSPETKIKHSAIIVDMIYNSGKERYEPVIATHTDDAWYVPWSKNAYRTHFVHITGVN